MKLGVTGHRPATLFPSNPYSEENMKKLIVFSTRMLEGIERQVDIDLVITGMALGFDQAIAEACINLDIPFVAYVPFEGYHGKWPHNAQVKYLELLSHAKEIKIITITSQYSSELLFKRNKAIVDDCDELLCLYNGQKSGTQHCVDYAYQQGKPIWKVWKHWVNQLD